MSDSPPSQIWPPPTNPADLIVRGASQAAPVAPAAGLQPARPLPPRPVADQPAAGEPRSLGRVRMPLRVILLQILVWSLIVLPLVFWLEFRPTHISREASWPIFAALSILASAVGMVLIPRWILRRHGHGDLISWRRPNRSDLLWAAAGLGWMAMTWWVYIAVVDSFGWERILPFDPHEFADVDAAPLPLPTAALWAVQAVLVAPLTEETFYRGFALGGLSRAWAVVPAALASAALFSVAHLSLATMIPFAFGGVIFGVLYLRTKSLTAPALAHAGWNAIALTISIGQFGIA